MQSSIALLCLVVLVCVHSTVTDTLDTQDTHLSRHRRVRSVDSIVDGLTTKFSKYLSSVFDVDEDDFKDILKALGKLKLAVLKALLNKFFDLKDKHHDFGSAENFQRVSQMMEKLEADIQQQEASSGAPAACVTMTSLTIPLLPVIAKVLN